MYKSACIEEARIESTLSHTDSKDVSLSQSCNDYDHAFDYQIDQWGVENLFHNLDEVIIRELKVYTEYWEKIISRTKSNCFVTSFLQNMVVWICITKTGRKYLSLTTNNFNLIKMMDGL